MGDAECHGGYYLFLFEYLGDIVIHEYSAMFSTVEVLKKQKIGT